MHFPDEDFGGFGGRDLLAAGGDEAHRVPGRQRTGVLVQLTDRPDELVRVLELAQALQWEKSRLSHHLARMQRRGLVAREDCPDDARGAFIVLTPTIEVAGGPHNIGWTHPEEVNKALLDFLSG